MSLLDRLFSRDARRKSKSERFARELSVAFRTSSICSDYENMFSQVRPLIDAMKIVRPYGIGKNGAKLPLKRTPELEVLNDPNDEMGYMEFMDLLFASWLTEDEVDIRAHFEGGSDRIIAYTVLPPSTRQYLGNGVWRWEVDTADGIQIIPESDVLRLRFSRSPKNPQKGISPASAVRVWAQIDDLISQYQRAYFENGAIPATITFITASTREKYEEAKDELERKLKGARNRNKTVYAWRQFNNDTGESADQVEVKTIQGNNSTLAIREIVEIVNDRLNKSVGVSNFILGDDSSAKYDNAELSDYIFTRRRVYPALLSFWNQFQSELDRVLGGLGYGISFDLVIPDLTDRKKTEAEIIEKKTSTLINLINSGASSLGACEALGLNENWQRVANDLYLNKLNSRSLYGDKKDQKKETVKKENTDFYNCAHYHKSLDALPAMTDKERAVYDELIKMAEHMIGDEGLLEYDPSERRAIIQELLNGDADDGAISGAEALIEEAKEKGVAEAIERELKAGDIYASETLKAKIDERAEKLVNSYGEHVRETFENALKNGEAKTANEIRDILLEAIPYNRAELIARNETVSAIQAGRIEQDEVLAKKYNLDVVLTWRTSNDGEVCPVCQAMEGQNTTLGEAFSDSGIYIDENGEEVPVTWEQNIWNDEGRAPHAHPNCRCYFEENIRRYLNDD